MGPSLMGQWSVTIALPQRASRLGRVVTNLALEMTGPRFENRPCAIGGLQEKERPHTMGWPTLAGAPVPCAHWSHGQVLTYVPCAVDRSQIVYVQQENKYEWALRDCQSVPNVNVHQM